MNLNYIQAKAYRALSNIVKKISDKNWPDIDNPKATDEDGLLEAFANFKLALEIVDITFAGDLAVGQLIFEKRSEPGPRKVETTLGHRVYIITAIGDDKVSAHPWKHPEASLEFDKSDPVTIITTEDAETLHRLGLLAEYTGVESYW